MEVILIIIIILLLIPTTNKITYSSCKPLPHPLIKQVFEENNIVYNSSNTWDIFLPCHGKIPSIIPPGSSIGKIEEDNRLGNRSTLWTTLVEYGGRKYAQQIMPLTYRFPQDINLLKKEYKPQIYFLKMIKQRQEGLKITSDLQEILSAYKDKYIQAQVNIPYALTYQGYKLNFRIYLIIICEYDSTVNRNYYIFNDGIVSYASKLLLGNENNYDALVASFYTAKQLYSKGFPLIISELQKTYPPNSMNKIWKEIIYRTKLLTDALDGKICQQKILPKRNHFQLFGLDYMFDINYRAYLLEANVGPGMDPRDERDRKMRTQVFRGIYQLLGLIKGDSNMIKIK